MATRKGYEFELETAELAGRYGQRVPRSGAYGTTSGIAQLAGDCRWKIPWLSKELVGECKHGYSRPDAKAKSMTLKREWFDKHYEQSELMNFFPFWAMKLKFTSERYILLPFPVMKKFLEEADELYKEFKEYEALSTNSYDVAMENKQLKDRVHDLEVELERERRK